MKRKCATLVLSCCEGMLVPPWTARTQRLGKESWALRHSKMSFAFRRFRNFIYLFCPSQQDTVGYCTKCILFGMKSNQEQSKGTSSMFFTKTKSLSCFFFSRRYKLILSATVCCELKSSSLWEVAKEMLLRSSEFYLSSSQKTEKKDPKTC